MAFPGFVRLGACDKANSGSAVGIGGVKGPDVTLVGDGKAATILLGNIDLSFIQFDCKTSKRHQSFTFYQEIKDG